MRQREHAFLVEATIGSHSSADCKPPALVDEQTGAHSTVEIGKTTTLPAGEQATVENVGTLTAAVLDFGIPAGPRGLPGLKGDPGDNPEMRFDEVGNNLVWKLSSSEQWTQLLDINQLQGEIIEETREEFQGYVSSASASATAAESAKETAETAKTAAESAKKSAVDAESAAFNYRQQASVAAQAANASVTQAKGYSNTAKGYMDEAEDFKDTAQAAATSAQTAAASVGDSVALAQEAASRAQTSAEAVAGDAEAAQTARDEAQTARDEAQTARDEAQTAASAARTSETKAARSETNAQTSEKNAKSYSQSAAADADRAVSSKAATDRAVDLWTGMTARANTLPSGSGATASYSNGVLTLGIPKGDKGDPGSGGSDVPTITIDITQILSLDPLMIQMTEEQMYSAASAYSVIFDASALGIEPALFNRSSLSESRFVSWNANAGDYAAYSVSANVVDVDPYTGIATLSRSNTDEAIYIALLDVGATTKIRNALPNVAEIGTAYYLGYNQPPTIVLPDGAPLGSTITFVWYNDPLMVLPLTIQGNVYSFDYAPSPGSRSELNCLWDGVYWSVVANEQKGD